MGLAKNSRRGQRLVGVSDCTGMGIVFITYFVFEENDLHRVVFTSLYL